MSFKLTKVGLELFTEDEDSKDVLHLDPANIPFNVFCVPTT